MLKRVEVELIFVKDRRCIQFFKVREKVAGVGMDVYVVLEDSNLNEFSWVVMFVSVM